MPEFSPGSEHIAHVPVSNPTSATFNYDAELYLVKDETKYATSGIVTFTLAPGGSDVIHFPVTMPQEQQTYEVYLDVFVEGQLVGAYQAIESVTVLPVAKPFTYSNMHCEVPEQPEPPWWWYLKFSCTITNPHNTTVTNIVTPCFENPTQGTGPRSDPPTQITLGPGASMEYRYGDNWLQAQQVAADGAWYMWVEDSGGGESPHCSAYP